MPDNVKWLDKYDTIDPSEHDGLAVAAAVHEFKHGHSQEDAAEEAHKGYLKNHAEDAAAFHYLGMRAALAAKNEVAAKKHGEAYAVAMKHLGHNITDAPPKEILDKTKNLEKNPYSFKSHKADGLFQPKEEEKKLSPKERVIGLVEKLKTLKTPES